MPLSVSGHPSFPHVWGVSTLSDYQHPFLRIASPRGPPSSPQHYRIALHTPTKSSPDCVRARQGAGSPHSPSPGDAPLRAGWLHACSHDPHPALRLNKFAADGCPTPAFPHYYCVHPLPPSNACDRDAPCCVTRLTHHMKVGSPDSAPMRLGSSISTHLRSSRL